jgi:hypothetical protein
MYTADSFQMQEISERLLKDRARWSILNENAHSAISRTVDCIIESRALIARLDAELCKLTTF